jgi:ABC-type spermidine/putrescine transport system permease subunit I
MCIVLTVAKCVLLGTIFVYLILIRGRFQAELVTLSIHTNSPFSFVLRYLALKQLLSTINNINNYVLRYSALKQLLSTINMGSGFHACTVFLILKCPFCQLRCPYQTRKFQRHYQLSSGAGFRSSLQPS